MDTVFVVIFGSIFVFIGLLSASFFFYRIYQAAASRFWPVAVGELLSSDIKESIFHSREGNRFSMVLDFKYHYSVDNNQISGTRVTYTDGINKSLRAKKKLKKKFEGKKRVKVYYNPKNPHQSVLIPGVGLFNFTPLITSTLFVLAGVYCYSLIG
mgnify:FL=1